MRRKGSLHVSSRTVRLRASIHSTGRSIFLIFLSFSNLLSGRPLTEVAHLKWFWIAYSVGRLIGYCSAWPTAEPTLFCYKFKSAPFIIYLTMLAKQIGVNLEEKQSTLKSSLYLRPFDPLDMKTLSETVVDLRVLSWHSKSKDALIRIHHHHKRHLCPCHLSSRFTTEVKLVNLKVK